MLITRRPLLGDWLGVSRRVVSNRTVRHLFCVFLYHCYYPNYFPFLFCPIKPVLSQPMSSTFFSPRFPPPSQWRGGGGGARERLRGVELPAGLNCDTLPGD